MEIIAKEFDLDKAQKLGISIGEELAKKVPEEQRPDIVNALLTHIVCYSEIGVESIEEIGNQFKRISRDMFFSFMNDRIEYLEDQLRKLLEK